MGLRKFERSLIKNQGSASSFKERLEKFRSEKYGEGNIPKNTMKKKQVHFDNSDQCFNALTWQKNMINTYMENLKDDKEKKAEDAMDVIKQ